MGGPHGHSPRGLLLLLSIGATATVAQWMMTRAYATGATLGIAALQYMGIVFGFAFGVWLFHDPGPRRWFLHGAIAVDPQVGAAIGATCQGGLSTLQHRVVLDSGRAVGLGRRNAHDQRRGLVGAQVGDVDLGLERLAEG